MQLFTIKSPIAGKGLSPIIISVPHSGTLFPSKQKKYLNEIGIKLPDTDWNIDKVFDFKKLDVSSIVSNISRHFVDLNRNSIGESLYTDGRPETTFTPTHNFNLDPLYKDKRSTHNSAEIERRKNRYYSPYHYHLSKIIQHSLRNFDHILLVEAHSIRRRVPSISHQDFSDITIGSVDGLSCPDFLIEIASNELSKSYNIALNTPFKGGFITRKWGSRSGRVYSMQLEIAQDTYMDEDNLSIKEDSLRSLQNTLENLLTKLKVQLE